MGHYKNKCRANPKENKRSGQEAYFSFCSFTNKENEQQNNKELSKKGAVTDESEQKQGTGNDGQDTKNLWNQTVGTKIKTLDWEGHCLFDLENMLDKLPKYTDEPATGNNHNKEKRNEPGGKPQQSNYEEESDKEKTIDDCAGSIGSDSEKDNETSKTN